MKHSIFKCHLSCLKAFILLIVFIFPNSIWSSDLKRDFFKDNMTSAQTADMIRYGDTRTSLFTGKMNFSIPVYSLSDPDFDLNVALCYFSDGFKPCKNSGYVGYNWFLQAGGCISREVRNYPDETYRYRFSISKRLEGMYHFAKNHSINKEDVFALDSNTIYNCGVNNAGPNIGNNCNISADYQPDIYHFNFCGYEGKFIINNNGKPVVICGDYISIDLSKTLDSKDDNALIERPLPVENSQITVITKDGYTYIFGGEISALEYSLSLKNSQQEERQFPPIVNTWHLSKIIAPNKRTITYYYKGHNEGTNPSNNLFVFSQFYDPFAISENLENHPIDQHIKFNYTKECILDSICISGEQPIAIYFYNSLAERMYKHSHYIARCYENYKLDSIQIRSGNRLIKHAVLSYDYKSHKISSTPYFYWRFLSNVTISGEGVYSLSYKHPLSYPNLYIETNDDYLGLMDLNGYWKDNPTAGLLNEVIFPTGGKQRYTYGTHTYQIERRFRRINANSDIELSSIDYGRSVVATGGRIEKIETFSNDVLVESTSFSYINNENPWTSTGIYYNKLAIYPQDENGTTLMVNTPNNYSLLDSHIGYSQVREVIKNGNGNILSQNIYSFDTGAEHYSTFNNPSINVGYSEFSIPYHVYSGALSYNEHLYGKGKIRQLDYYKDGGIVKSIQYVYNGVPLSQTELIPQNQNQLGCVDTIVIFSNFGSIPVARKLFVYPDVLNQEVTTTFSSEVDLITNKTYQYDKKLRLKHETITDSRDISHFTKYTYPDEINVSDDDFIFNPNALYLLRRSNRISEPIETVSGYMENNHEYLTSGKINLYTVGSYLEFPPNSHHAPSHNPVVPDWLDSISYPGGGIRDSLIDSVVMIRQYPYLHKTLSLSMTEPIADYQAMGANGSIVTYDDRYALDMEYSFDPMGRPTFVKPFGASATTYTWEGIYPKTKFVGKQKYTYTYIPYVGINSVTDPRGITTYYTYDANGRLVETYQIVNGKKQILNAYRYHVKSELL